MKKYLALVALVALNASAEDWSTYGFLPCGYTTDATVQKICDINHKINTEIKPREIVVDAPTYDWESEASVGDCKDYSMTKYHLLKKSGLNAKLAAVTTKILHSSYRWTSYVKHAITIVSYGGYDWILDNMTGNEIRRADLVLGIEYTVDSMQVVGNQWTHGMPEEYISYCTRHGDREECNKKEL